MVDGHRGSLRGAEHLLLLRRALLALHFFDPHWSLPEKFEQSCDDFPDECSDQEMASLQAERLTNVLTVRR